MSLRCVRGAAEGSICDLPLGSSRKTGYELLFPQLPSFQNHLHCPGVRGTRFRSPALCLCASVANPFLFSFQLPASSLEFPDTCRLFCRSSPFSNELTPLQSSKSSLFLQSTG